jgi:dUTP pyrophosphatase
MNDPLVREKLKALHTYTYCIEVEILEGGYLPSKKHRTDAGFDVYATDDIELHPGDVIKHPLNIRMKLPKGSWARIETKSGLGAKGMLVYAGVIDEGYRGVPHVIMTNLNHHEHGDIISFKKGDKIAQITINPHSTEFYMQQVSKVDTATERSENGFGSTGV